jgi:inner membrane protein
MFIIDPLYTLPLLVGVVAALRHPQGLRWNQAGLVLSTAYLGWSLLAQQHVRGVLEEALRAQGLPASQVLVTPAPFSTVLWRAVAMGPEHYHEAYYSLLDGGAPVQWTQHPRGSALRAAHTAHPHVQRLERFSHGFMRVQASPEGRLQITDLRMGLEPCYSFHFDVGPAIPAEGAAAVEGDLPTQQWQRPDLRTGLAWWWQRLSDPSAGPLSRVPGVSSCGR